MASEEVSTSLFIVFVAIFPNEYAFLVKKKISEYTTRQIPTNMAYFSYDISDTLPGF